MGSGAGEQGSQDRRGGRPHCGVHRAEDRNRGVPRRAAGLTEGPQLPAAAGAGAEIPKANGKLRRLGIATIADRVVQASLKLVLEPVFEADFLPRSYGFRPNRRAHDAVAEVRHFTSHSYEWVVEGDIKACFDEISHTGLLARVRDRVGDKRVLALVKAFLKAGILGEDRVLRENNAGTPQGSILTPGGGGKGGGGEGEGGGKEREEGGGEGRRGGREGGGGGGRGGGGGGGGGGRRGRRGEGGGGEKLLSNVALTVLDEFIASILGVPALGNWNGRSAVVAVCPTSGWSGSLTTGA